MLKSVIQRNHNIDIKYAKLMTWLKKNSKGYKAKQSNVLRGDAVQRFLSEANDQQYLAAKVIMIFGVYGASRADELTKVETKDVRKEGAVYIIKYEDTKTNIMRSFTVEDEYATYVEKYIALRPINVPHNRFFVNYQKGKCTQQPIGRNKFLGTPKLIADFLGLENAASYTGHSLRRSSATLLVDGGADILTLKRHGGWRSSASAEGYLENSVGNKRKIGAMISAQIQKESKSSSSTVTSPSEIGDMITEQTLSTVPSPSFIVPLSETTSSTTTTALIMSQSNVRTSATDGSGIPRPHSMEFNSCKEITINITYAK